MIAVPRHARKFPRQLFIRFKANTRLFASSALDNVTKESSSTTNADGNDKDASTADWLQIWQQAIDERERQQQQRPAMTTAQESPKNDQSEELKNSWAFYRKYAAIVQERGAMNDTALPLNVASLFPYQSRLSEQTLAQSLEHVKASLAMDDAHAGGSCDHDNQLIFLSAQEFLTWMDADYREYGCRERVLHIAELMQQAGYESRLHLKEFPFVEKSSVQ